MEQQDDGPVSAAALDRVTWALRRAVFDLQSLKEQRPRPSQRMPLALFTLLISLPAGAGLESRGQLERRPHPRHRHVQELHLTEAGRELLRQADILVEEVEQKITKGLGRADTGRLRALLEKVAATAQET